MSSDRQISSSAKLILSMLNTGMTLPCGALPGISSERQVGKQSLTAGTVGPTPELTAPKLSGLSPGSMHLGVWQVLLNVVCRARRPDLCEVFHHLFGAMQFAIGRRL